MKAGCIPAYALLTAGESLYLAERFPEQRVLVMDKTMWPHSFRHSYRPSARRITDADAQRSRFNTAIRRRTANVPTLLKLAV
jgi:hypothetical protein